MQHEYPIDTLGIWYRCRSGPRWVAMVAQPLGSERNRPLLERDKLVVNVERGGGHCVNECLTTVKRPLTWGSGQPMGNQKQAIAGIC